MIKGIGPIYAKKLVRAFSEAVFDVIEQKPERLHEVGKLRILGELVLAGGLHVEDFATQRQDGLRGAVARLLG